MSNGTPSLDVDDALQAIRHDPNQSCVFREQLREIRDSGWPVIAAQYGHDLALALVGDNPGHAADFMSDAAEAYEAADLVDKAARAYEELANRLFDQKLFGWAGDRFYNAAAAFVAHGRLGEAQRVLDRACSRFRAAEDAMQVRPFNRWLPEHTGLLADRNKTSNEKLAKLREDFEREQRHNWVESCRAGQKQFSELVRNPYFNRSTINDEQYFFGRVGELSKIYSLVLQGQLVAVLGERRIGKSSILKALSFDKHLYKFDVPENRRFIFVDGQYFASDSEQDFLAVLLGKISEETGTVSLEPQRQSLVRAAKQLASQPNPLSPVIVIDEIDVLADNENIHPDFFAYLRAWAQEFRVAFVIAIREGSFENLLKTQGPGSPFWNVFTSVYVGPLDEAATLDLIRTPADRRGTTFNEEEVRWILNLGGRHPFFLQMACYQMLEMVTAKNGKAQDFSMVEQEFRREATPQLDYLMGQLPEPEREALWEYALRLILPKKKIQDELLRKGFLVQEGEEVRLFSVALGEMIRSQPVAVSRQSLAGKIQQTLLDYGPARLSAVRRDRL